jgi:hypothetical protein
MQHCKGCKKELKPNTQALAVGNAGVSDDKDDVVALIFYDYYCDMYCLIKHIKDLITAE